MRRSIISSFPGYLELLHLDRGYVAVCLALSVHVANVYTLSCWLTKQCQDMRVIPRVNETLELRRIQDSTVITINRISPIVGGQVLGYPINCLCTREATDAMKIIHAQSLETVIHCVCICSQAFGHGQAGSKHTICRGGGRINCVNRHPIRIRR